MKKALATACLLALAWGSQALAQDKLKVDPVPLTAATESGGIKSQNILDVKPEASADPDYAKQTKGERAKVQPGNNAPMWRQVGAGVTGFSSLPTPEAGNLIQPFVQYPGSRVTNAGEAWRQVRNEWIIPYGGSLFLIVLGAIALVYWRKGPIQLHGKETGRKIERFTAFERSAHWANAIAFSILAVSGLFMAFGKFFLHPVIGGTLYGWLVYLLKNMHNFAGPLFAVSLVVVIVTFIRDALPRKEDITWLLWLLKGGPIRGGQEMPSHRFNAGQKMLFWGGVLGLGLIVVGSGLLLDKLIPGLLYDRSTMQITHMVHAVATVLMMTLFLIHIYLGTIGMEGAYDGMKTGYVDEAWAKEHHELWYDDVKAGKIPAQRSQAARPGSTVQA